MDYKEPQAKRNKKKDKAREKVDRNGHFSSKHVRQQSELASKHPVKGVPQPPARK